MLPPTPTSTLFPYTTLFRSHLATHPSGARGRARRSGPHTLRRGPRELRVCQEFYFFDVDRKSTRLNSSHLVISYAVFCLKKKNTNIILFIFYKILLIDYH